MIKFSVKKSGSVKLLVYDIQGQLIKAILNENKNPGTYTVEFNGSKLSSGFYYYEIESGHSRKVKKMLLLK
ncbi:MAG: hypothetical protein A2000_05160 [Ignavibacteria bacterium GWB2_36_8]|nr:MAG: hypothetical protein A2000_05160 [Ignavibacteria bacterium GWB2_36_8]